MRLEEPDFPLLHILSDTIPRLSPDWVRRIVATTENEILAARNRGYVPLDTYDNARQAHETIRSQIQDLLLDKNYMSRLDDKFFLLLLINLYEK